MSDYRLGDNNTMPTESNAVTVHTIFKSTMTGDDGAEILYCLPASCKIILVKFLWHPFPFQAGTITSLQPNVMTILPINLEEGAEEIM
jgi:hypothetical protein